MKLLFSFFFALSTLFAFPTLEHSTANQQEFTLIKEKYDIYDSKGLVMKMYYEENNRNLRFVLSLILDDMTGDCSKKSIQKGTYTFKESELILYHFWRREGKAYDAPYGAMIEVYQIKRGGKLEKTSSKVYIESMRKHHDPESGMKYLFDAPKNAEEKEVFSEYIKEIEKKYDATFVYKEEAKALIKEVRKALKSDMWK